VTTVVNVVGLTIAVPKCFKWDKDAVKFTVCEDLGCFNTNDNVYVPVVMVRPLQEFTRFI